jgi:hypothetical protein
MTNSTPWAVKDAMNSSKSRARSIDLPPQKFDSRDPFGRRPRQPVAQPGPVALLVGEGCEMHHALQFRWHWFFQVYPNGHAR